PLAANPSRSSCHPSLGPAPICPALLSRFFLCSMRPSGLPHPFLPPGGCSPLHQAPLCTTLHWAAPHYTVL
ncbi:unnamed protein product, partial [Closterium sp. Naga37s-1]